MTLFQAIHSVLSSKSLRFIPQRLHTKKTSILRVLKLSSLFRTFYYSQNSPATPRCECSFGQFAGDTDVGRNQPTEGQERSLEGIGQAGSRG